MNGRTRTTGAATAIGGLFAVVACAPGNGGESTAEQAEETSQLRVAVWTGNEEHLTLFDEIAEDFIEQHETLDEVEFEVLPYDDYTDALTVQLAGGNPPDLGWIFERNAPEFIDSGVLADIGPELQDDPGYGYEDLTEATIELWGEGNELYAYPFSTSPFSMFYNAEMFAEAGLETPQELYESGEWTWENARDAAAEIVAQEVAPHGFIVGDFEYTIWDNLATVWRGFDAQAWSEDGDQCGFTSPEMVEAMTFFHGAVFEDQAHPGPGQSADFFASDSAMTITQISRANQLEEGGFDWGLVPLPEGPGSPEQVVGQAGIGVFSASENQQAATEFLMHMTNEENSRKLAEYFPPPRASLLTAEVLAESNPVLTEEQLEAAVVEGIENGRSIPTHTNFAQLQDTIRAELDGLWEADADIEAVLEDVCTAAEPLLE